MISFQQIRSLFVTMSVSVILAITLAFSLGTPSVLAANTVKNSVPTQIATKNKVEAVTKNIEGKVQEAYGNVTDNPKQQVIGKAKQVESEVRNTAEDIKNKT